MNETEKKEMTIDELATMVANGFLDMSTRMVTKDELLAVETRLHSVESEIISLRNEAKGLRESVNRYLELSDKKILGTEARK